MALPGSDFTPAHGGLHDDELAALGIDPDDVLDVSVNVNPYGPSPRMIDAVRAAPIHRYPDPTSTAARRALAEAAGVEPGRIALGNGAVDLLWTLARVLVRAGEPFVVAEPTFSEFPRAAIAAGGHAVPWRASEERGFAIDLDAIAASVERANARLLYLCAPANPTGATAPTDAIAELARRLPSTVVVLDQAFLSLSTRFADRDHPMPANVVQVRSLTKDHALPGLRVGYAIADHAVIARIEAGRPPWTTSAPAQAAAVAALDDGAFIDASRARLLGDRQRLAMHLGDGGLVTLASSPIYLLVRAHDATAVRRRLLTHHRVLVRDCTSFGLPHHIRICARPEADDARLVGALREEVPR
jgi:histidinol-phosphate aminotransferase